MAGYEILMTVHLKPYKNIQLTRIEPVDWICRLWIESQCSIGWLTVLIQNKIDFRIFSDSRYCNKRLIWSRISVLTLVYEYKRKLKKLSLISSLTMLQEWTTAAWGTPATRTRPAWISTPSTLASATRASRATGWLAKVSHQTAAFNTRNIVKQLN